jgi:6-phosphogluconolactonase
VRTIPAGFSDRNTTADVLVAPSGRFVYGSNRGHDSIAIYAVDQGTGKLEHVDHRPSLGSYPRALGFDQEGGFLLVANVKSNTIVSLRVDSDTGSLSPTGEAIAVPAPTCVKVVRLIV